MNYDFLSNNKVYLCGEVVSKPVFSHEIYGEGFYELSLSVPRLSGYCDVVPITISERLLTDDNFALNKKVAVKGQFRSYNKIIDNKSRLLLTVFVREVVEVDETQNPNVVEILGYVCKPPIFRTTPFNREICDVLLAVNRAYNKSDYLPCIAWGRNARFIKSLAIGEKVVVTGRIQSRDYQKHTTDGDIVKTAYEISICKIQTTKECETGDNEVIEA
ncbi:MAG: single-stranded DNA-binding protein [Clostridia bacterium]|nr:single-stranded DNA-binding protein [Clostridia bacterium]